VKPFDTPEINGFAVAGDDKKWYWAKAEIAPGGSATKLLVSSPEVKKPVAVRYAWADNPVCNLRGTNGLPACPFRSDDWPGVTIDAKQ
jgi:sialate O-acetylesterase